MDDVDLDKLDIDLDDPENMDDEEYIAKLKMMKKIADH